MDIRTAAAERKQENYRRFSFSATAVRALIARVLNETYADTFVIEALPEAGTMDSFILSDQPDGKILLRASSATAAAAAVRWYLQEKCGCYVGPISRRMALPQRPPKIGTTYQNASPFLYRYFFNYCTFGYTCAFWDWEQWERFLDWLLLSGYNLILNPLGNERVWVNTLRRLGYSLDDARRFISSPVFYPWQCMLNLSGWAGAAPEHWYDERVELSKKIISRLNEMGVNVVLPGYSGIVPDDFRQHFPDAVLLGQGGWCEFSRPSLISFESPLFARLAEIYYDEQDKLFGGCTAYFSVDPFHEGGNSSKINMADYGRCCYEGMHRTHEHAVWLLQGWSTNPNRQLLNALRPQDVLVANLKSEVNVDGGDDFVHRPWMYGCVNNFGGRRVPRANLNSQLSGPHRAIADARYAIAGIAMLPEGVEVDECAFDVFSDLMFRSEPLSAEDWQTQYILHRYGCESAALEDAWSRLRRDVYISDTSSTPKESALCTRPSLTISMVTPACATSDFTYDPMVLLPIIRSFLKERDNLRDTLPYRADLTELMRQLVALTSWLPVGRLQSAFLSRDRDRFETAAEELLRLFDYQCMVMADSPALPLHEQLANATRYGKTEAEKAYFSRQLKQLITSWGDRNASEILHDYACREWSGMLEVFYRPRWERYIQFLRQSFGTQCTPQELDRAYPHYELEQEFCHGDDAACVIRTEKRDFAYAQELLAFCERLLKAQPVSVANRKQSGAMELK